MACLFLGNLALTTTEQELCEAFHILGFQVQRSRIIRDCLNGQSKGFGFVELSPAEDQEKAVAELRGTRIGGRTVRVYRMKPLSGGQPVNAAQRQEGAENTDEIGARPVARFVPPSVLRGKEPYDCVV